MASMCARCLWLLLLARVCCASLDWSAANLTVFLSAASYCPTELYLTLNFSAATVDFEVTRRILDPTEDTNGFVGVARSSGALAVAFRGSEDVRNWLSDMDMRRADYPPCDRCQAHRGFLDAATKVVGQVREEVARLLRLHPGFEVLVAGHSLGAALATLVAADLRMDRDVNQTRISLFCFGSPRVFNDVAAQFVSETLAGVANRFTHLRDAVVHVPYREQGFEHISDEWYEDGSGVHACVGPEDKDCADKWTFQALSFADHVVYLRTVMACNPLLLL